MVHEGTIREKPLDKDEARQFIKGLVKIAGDSYCLGLYELLMVLPAKLAGYSGAHAATVSSVVVTNLNTGFRKGEWDRVEVILLLLHHGTF